MCHILFALPFVGLVLFWLLPLEQAIFFYSLILIVCAALYWLMWKDFWRPVATGVEGMIGGKAEVIQNGNATLKVFFRGEIWDAISPKDLSVGQRVEITGVERMRVVVRPVSSS
jgi:membrane protein implicated in regulation of membrane protease activity